MNYSIMTIAAMLLERSGDSGSTIFSLLQWAALLLGYWILFMKAGEEGWMSLVPLLGTYKMFEMVYGNGWKMLLMLVPGLNIVLWIGYCIRFAQVFDRHWAFGIGMLFCPQIMILYFAFSSARYTGPVYKFI